MAVANEYFANGILVHNCDALAWACLELDRTVWAAPQLVEAPPIPHVGPLSVLQGREALHGRLNPFLERKRRLGQQLS